MERLINSFSTRLAADITSGATSCTVVTGVPAALVGHSARMIFYDVPGGNAEIVLATCTTATSWTIQRAVEDATRFPARGWTAVGTTIEAVLTADGVGQVVAVAGNLLHVDAVFGNDTTALPDRADRPYLTLAAAQTAALAGDTIRVRPGTYTIPSPLGKHLVNWCFEVGATVTWTQGESTGSGIWATDSVGCSYRVSGHGVFDRAVTAHVSGPAPSVVAVTHSGANVVIDCLDIIITDTAAGLNPITLGPRGVTLITGNTVIRCRDIRVTGVAGADSEASTTGDAIWWENGEASVSGRQCRATKHCIYSAVSATPTGDLHTRFDDYTAINSSTIYTTGSNSVAALWVRGNTIRSTVFGRSVYATGSERLYIEAQKLFGLVFHNGPGLFFLRADKVSAVVPTFALLAISASGQSWISINDWDTTSLTTSAWSFMASTGGTNIFGGVIRPVATANGVAAGAGLYRLIGTRIDTSLNSAGNPITKSGGTLTLKDCTLLAHSTRNAIEASTAQTVVVEGTLSANRPLSANVTTTGGPVVRTDTGVVTASGFSGLPGLVVWLDPTFGLFQERTGPEATTPATTNGHPVGTWRARTGQYWTAPSDAARPVLRFNGVLPYLEFDGVDATMFAALAGTRPYTVGIRSRSFNASNGRALSSGPGVSNWALGALGTENCRHYTGEFVGTSQGTLGQWFTASAIGTPTLSSWRFNGAQVASTATGLANWGDNLALGSNGNGGEFGTVDVAGVLVYKAALLPAELAIVESYLGTL